MADRLLRDVIDIPERVLAGDFVLRLSDSLSSASAIEQTLANYVVTPQLTEAFDQALGIVRAAVQQNSSKAAYLHGSFGSGKSHFMAVLHALLNGEPAARERPEFHPLLARHDSWLGEGRFLLIPFHLIDAASLESAILGGYIKHIQRERPGTPLPPVFLDDRILTSAANLRARMGEEQFIAGLPAGDSAWGDLGTGWTSAELDTAFAAPPASSERQRLVGDLLSSWQSEYAETVRGTAEAYVPLEDGLSLISQHAHSLGYQGIVLFLDELVLWLASKIGDQGFVTREAQKVAKLVESGESHRPAPIVSFIARQRDLRELVGKDVAGAEATSFFDVLKYWDGRFDLVTLENRNLREIARRRILRPIDDAAKAEIDSAFDRTTQTRPEVWDALLDAEGSGGGDAQGFRATYPFSPAFVNTLVDVSGALQRERTALKLMQQILSDRRDTLVLGQLVPLGDLYDVLTRGQDTPFTDKLRIEFENVKTFYTNELRPWLLERHGLTEDQVPSLPQKNAFRAHDRVVKTLLLAALVPQVPALRGLTAGRLAALNYGSITSPIPGREKATIAGWLKELSQQFGQIRVTDTADPAVEIALIGVDTNAVLAQVTHVDGDGARRVKLKELLWETLHVTDDGQFVNTHPHVWRGSKRTMEVVYGKIRDASTMSNGQFEPLVSDHVRVVIDYPFDEGDLGPADSRNRVQTLAERISAPTLCWIPSFLSRERLEDLGNLVKIEYLLQRDRLEEIATAYTVEDKQRLREQLGARRAALSAGLTAALAEVYGVAKPEERNVGRSIDEHVLTLEPGFTTPSLPPGASLADALVGQVDALLAHRYPRHPDFDLDASRRELTLKELKTALQWITEAAENPVGRAEVTERADRRAVQRVVVPLQLGTLTESVLVLNRDWRMEVEKQAAAEGITAEIEVRDLRRWLDEPPRRGLDKNVANLMIATYAAQANRAWVYQGGIVEPPTLEKIDNQYTLRQQELPSHDEYQLAAERASVLFGVTGEPHRSARTVQKLAGLVLNRVQQLEPQCVRLAEELARRSTVMGLGGGAPIPRLETAREAVQLLAQLSSAQNNVALVRELATTQLPVSATALAKSMSTAGRVADRLAAVRWEVIDGLREQVESGSGSDRAQTLLSRLRSTAERDELTSGLVEMLDEADRTAFSLLRREAPTGPAPTPRPAPLPGTAPVTTTGGESPQIGPGDVPLDLPGAHTRTVDQEELPGVLEELRSAAQQHPSARIEITWRIVT